MAAQKAKVPAKVGKGGLASGIAAAVAVAIANKLTDPEFIKMLIDRVREFDIPKWLQQAWKLIKPRPLHRTDPADRIRDVLNIVDSSIAQYREAGVTELPLDRWAQSAKTLRMALPAAAAGDGASRRKRVKDLKRRAADLLAEIYAASVKLSEEDSK